MIRNVGLIFLQGRTQKIKLLTVALITVILLPCSIETYNRVLLIWNKLIVTNIYPKISCICKPQFCLGNLTSNY